MTLLREHRRYLLIYQSVIPLLINVAVCGLIGAIEYRDLDRLPVWQAPPSAAADLLATSFLLPFLTCWIATALVRRDVRRDRISAINADAMLPVWLRRLHRWLPLRALLFGAVGIALVGGVALVVLAMLPVSAVNVRDFLAIKLVFAGTYGAAVTPLIALLALADGIPV